MHFYKNETIGPYIFLFCISYFLFGLWSKIGGRRRHSQPNVIIILTDDQAWGDLGMNGNTNINTPHIDAIAQDGATFNNFYVCAVCSPTRAELLTGRYHFRSGIYSTGGGGERMDVDETTIAEVFKNAGYQTGCLW